MVIGTHETSTFQEECLCQLKYRLKVTEPSENESA